MIGFFIILPRLSICLLISNNLKHEIKEYLEVYLLLSVFCILLHVSDIFADCQDNLFFVRTDYSFMKDFWYGFARFGEQILWKICTCSFCFTKVVSGSQIKKNKNVKRIKAKQVLFSVESNIWAVQGNTETSQI